MSDPVHHPPHYCHEGFEIADVVNALLDDANLSGSINFWYGNLLKYAMRWPFKGKTPAERIRDLQKAIECANRTITAYKRDRALDGRYDGYNDENNWAALVDKTKTEITDLKRKLSYYQSKAEAQHYEDALEKVKTDR